MIYSKPEQLELILQYYDRKSMELKEAVYHFKWIDEEQLVRFNYLTEDKKSLSKEYLNSITEAYYYINGIEKSI